MAALTAYQIQFRQRAKKTIQRRTDADRKVRAYARLLAAALGEASDVADAVTLLNKTYKLDLGTQTVLVKVLTEEVGAQLLSKVLAENPAGEALAPFKQVPDANGGKLLKTDAGFGERVTASVPKAVAGRAATDGEGKSAQQQTAHEAVGTPAATEMAEA